jgi:carbamoyltransferase
MKILAFNISHDSSVAYMDNGKLKFFCKEERVSKFKRDMHPFKSLEIFKNNFDVKIDECLYLTPSNHEPDIQNTYSAYVKKFFNIKLTNYSGLMHHSCHASLAFFNSGFDTALVFVIDRNGSLFFINSIPEARESESVYVASKNKGITPIYKNYHLLRSERRREYIEKTIQRHFPSECLVRARSLYGIVMMYEAATTLIGQHQLENGKTMGLSSYCDKTNFPILTTNGIVDGRHFQSSDDVGDHEVCFIDNENNITQNITPENHMYYAEKAKHVQIESQNAVLELISKYVHETGINNVCIVGGYGLNVVANNHYVKNAPNVNFYFEPVSDDTGISIGAVMLRHFEKTGVAPNALLDNFYHYYDETELLEIGKSANLDQICDLIIAQKSVAIFDGNPESGPRSLGHRSILFDARNKDCKDLVNKIKNREWYRPFAGIILQEYFEEYFETLGLKKSEYMTINFDAKENTKLMVPGIIHVDGTCRIQTVSDGFMYNLLTEFYKRTGCPMLLNTSFNMAGQPLVQTKADAIDVHKNSLLDAVFFVDDQKILLK